MKIKMNVIRYRKALTLLEMVIALAIVSVLFAVVLPAFTNAGSSWQARQAASESIQNGRVLVDYIHNQLIKAVKIINVSDPAQTNGFIEFEDASGTTLRFDIAATNYVQFGEVDSLSELAGPVTRLQFTCYALDDLSTPITDPSLIRFVKVETELTNESLLGSDKIFATSACIQTSGVPASTETVAATLEFDSFRCKYPVLSKMSDAYYFCTYEGDDGDGWAMVLKVDTSVPSITKISTHEFDKEDCELSALAQINPVTHLCAYEGDNGDGWATILFVYPLNMEISQSASFEFDKKQGKEPSLAKIDDNHYLCAYSGDKDDGWATVLTVDPATWEITKEAPFEFNKNNAEDPSLIKIDATHYLCAYEGRSGDGWATILQVDPETWKITKRDSFEFDKKNCETPDLIQIDSTHYLCAYAGGGDDGYATVLEIDTEDWSISSNSSVEFNTRPSMTTDLAPIKSGGFLCVYERCAESDTHDGWFSIFNVNSSNWTQTYNTPYEYAPERATDTVVIHVTDDYFLSLYSGSNDDGWAALLNISASSGVKP